MKTEKIITIDRKELISFLEKKIGKKFWKTKLSSTGFKGWLD